ncbi:MAG: shikimate dehydrogenase [Pseudomonadota bacterium]
MAAPPDTTSPDRYAVLGNPVAHSRSPFIHAAFAAATGERLVYERVLAPMDGFEAALQAFAAAGGRGCNVTVPFKFDAARLCPRLGQRARLAEAANVLRFDKGEEGGWFGDNTDGVGLVNDLQANADVPLAGRRVLLVGAGGAAAGALGPLLEAAPAELVVANRSPAKAEALCARHQALAAVHGVALRASDLASPGKAFDVVINASASSLAGAAVPVPASVLGPGALALDMMYGPAAAGFLAWAAQHGAQGRDGLGMLVEQAAEAFWLWRGVRPATGPVLAALRAQLAHEALAA